MMLSKLNRVYVVVWRVTDGVALRESRWTWSRARADRWAAKLNAQLGRKAYTVAETRLF